MIGKNKKSSLTEYFYHHSPASELTLTLGCSLRKLRNNWQMLFEMANNPKTFRSISFWMLYMNLGFTTQIIEELQLM
jgi:hypothetical protein